MLATRAHVAGTLTPARRAVCPAGPPEGKQKERLQPPEHGGLTTNKPAARAHVLLIISSAG